MIRERVRVCSNPGSPNKDLYHARYDDRGCVELVHDGHDDLYSRIQSYADSVDIHVLLKRFANGDVDALSKTQGIYADVTGIPKTYAELLNTVNDLERKFLALPVEVREKFGNSFAQYAATLGTEDYFNALGVKPMDDTVVEGGVADESKSE